MPEVRLYDAEGQHLSTAEAEREPNREGILIDGGWLYIWNQRNAQWRLVREVVKIKKDSSEPVETDTEPISTHAP
jgi:hypothetical protein